MPRNKDKVAIQDVTSDRDWWYLIGKSGGAEARRTTIGYSFYYPTLYHLHQ